MALTIDSAPIAEIRAALVREQWQMADDIERGWEAGAPPDAEEALRGQEWDKSVVLHLAIREFHLRKRAGESLDARSFCRKFPSYASSLALCLEARDMLAPFMAAPAWPQSGEALDGLQVVEELGRGAFARAYLARDQACGGRLTVLKLSPDGAREAGTLGKLSHANIVSVLNAKHFPERGLSGLTTLFHGRATLCDVLDAAFGGSGPPQRGRLILRAVERTRASLPPALPAGTPDRRLTRGSYDEAVLHVGRRICSALQAAHEQGVLHLDLKPSNVLLAPSGEPLLLDFHLSQDAALPGLVGGTLPYMSPEQLGRTMLGETVAVDARSDLFSLGVLLHQLLCGELPFDLFPGDVTPVEQARHLLARQAAGPNPPPLDRRLTPGVRTILRRCLAVEPAKRFASAEELAAAIDKELSPLGTAKRWAAQHPRGIAATLAIVLLTGVSLGAMAALRDPLAVREFNEAQVRLAAGDYAGAVEHFSLSLLERPGHVETLFRRGIAFQRMGEFRKALDDYEDASKLSPDPRILAGQAFCAMRTGSPDAALALFRKALAAGWDNAQLRNDLGYVLLLKARQLDALPELNAALSKEPKLATALHSRAVLWMRMAQQARTDADKDRYLTAGLSDIDEALWIGPRRGDKFFLQANLLNAGVDPANLDPRTVDKVMEALTLAADHGADLRALKNDKTFAHMFQDPRFGVLLARPRRNERLWKEDRLLDPLPNE